MATTVCCLSVHRRAVYQWLPVCVVCVFMEGMGTNGHHCVLLVCA